MELHNFLTAVPRLSIQPFLSLRSRRRVMLSTLVHSGVAVKSSVLKRNSQFTLEFITDLDRLFVTLMDVRKHSSPKATWWSIRGLTLANDHLSARFVVKPLCAQIPSQFTSRSTQLQSHSPVKSKDVPKHLPKKGI